MDGTDRDAVIGWGITARAFLSAASGTLPKWVTDAANGRDQVGAKEILDGLRKQTRRVAIIAEQNGIDSTPFWDFASPRCSDPQTAITLTYRIVAKLDSIGQQVETKSAPAESPVADTNSTPPQPATVNERMFAILGTRPESQGWTARQWAACLECVPSTVTDTDAWQSLKVVKASASIDRAEKRRNRPNKTG